MRSAGGRSPALNVFVLSLKSLVCLASTHYAAELTVSNLYFKNVYDSDIILDLAAPVYRGRDKDKDGFSTSVDRIWGNKRLLSFTFIWQPAPPR